MEKNILLPNLDDRALLKELAGGEKNALEVFYNRHSGKVLNFCLKRGLSVQQAEDICQIVFLQLYRKSKQYNPQFEPLAWLFVISKSEMRDYLKKNKKEISLESTPRLADSREPVLAFENKDEVSELLEHLSERDRKVVQMFYLDELTYSEIARALRVNESTLRKIASRSLQFLSQLKGEHS